MKLGLDYSDVLLVPQPSSVASRKDVDLMVLYRFLHSGHQYNGIPIICANMESVATPAMGKVLAEHNLSLALPKGTEDADTTVNVHSGVWFTSGITKDLSIFDALVDDAMVCLDVANGYMDSFMEFVAAVRRAHPQFVIMAGNIATPIGAARLYNAGADIVKIGIGAGSVCTTRLKTGVGYPQFSALLDCRSVARDFNRYICSDGGFVTPGDVAKAFGGGADFIMSGYLFSGANEANLRYEGSAVSTGGNDYRTSEGKSVSVPGPRSSAKEIVMDLLGGLRSACSYCGFNSLEDFIGNGEFVQVNRTHNTVFGA